MRVWSLAFEEGGMIPTQYTCDGEDISPELAWENAPKETKSFALILNDPDAPSGNFVHWIIWNIPKSSSGLPQGMANDPVLPGGARQGRNGAKQIGYSGPCPPSSTHKYFFTLYALDVVLDLMSGATEPQLKRAIEGHELAKSQTLGLYKRQ